MQITRLLIIITTALSLTACNSTGIRRHADLQTSPVATAVATTQQADSAIDDSVPVNIPATVTRHETGNQVVETETTQKNYPDIWLQLQHNLVFERHLENRSVKDKLAWYVRNQDYLDRVAERARPYIYYISEQLMQRNMPLDLALLPIIESAYHPFAYSPSKASGIWQFIPSTGRIYGLKQNWWYDGRRDIVAATNAALNYLEKLHKEFNGDWLLALAAYNSGEMNVARAIKSNIKAGKKTDFWSLRLPRETRGYVPSLLAVAELVAKPSTYGVHWQPIANEPYFAQVDVGGQLDLAMAAKLADLSMDEIYTLNPGFNRWATDPDGPHYLLIPVDKLASFSLNMADLPENERVSWKRHVIRKGETLGQIAERYHTSLTTLKQSNNLRSNLIRTGHSLLIPSSKQPLQHYSLSLDSRRYRGLKRAGSGEKYIYTVRRGDTLWDLGRQYGVSIKQLCQWNGIASRSLLRPGQQLNLWFNDDNKTAEDAGVEGVVAVNLEQDDKPVANYTVKKGDSLWLISRRFGVTVAQLLQWNNIPRGKFLQPGQELILYTQRDTTTGA